MDVRKLLEALSVILSNRYGVSVTVKGEGKCISA